LNAVQRRVDLRAGTLAVAVEAVAFGLALALTVAVGVDGGPLPGDLEWLGGPRTCQGGLKIRSRARDTSAARSS
jgi:hypothetical protein